MILKNYFSRVSIAVEHFAAIDDENHWIGHGGNWTEVLERKREQGR